MTVSSSSVSAPVSAPPFGDWKEWLDWDAFEPSEETRELKWFPGEPHKKEDKKS